MHVIYDNTIFTLYRRIIKSCAKFSTHPVTRLGLGLVTFVTSVPPSLLSRMHAVLNMLVNRSVSPSIHGSVCLSVCWSVSNLDFFSRLFKVI